jgi:hypothetical protein
MKIRVERHAGHRGDEEPSAFMLGARRLDVVEIVDRWVAPDRRYFKVATENGQQMVLRHDTASGQWELAALVGQGRSTAKSLH